MIPVAKQPEPDTFDATVRQPGLAAMQAHTGTWSGKAFWNHHNYWSACLGDLHTLYNETCAYLAVRIARHKTLDIKGASVEHFVPVNVDRSLAYKWDNYRLVCGLANSERKDTVPFLDPFTVPANAFQLLLNSGKVIAAPTAAGLDTRAVKNTLKVINNQMFACYRADLFERYITKPKDGKPKPDALKAESPFIYQEALRQGALPA